MRANRIINRGDDIKDAKPEEFREALRAYLAAADWIWSGTLDNPSVTPDVWVYVASFWYSADSN